MALTNEGLAKLDGTRAPFFPYAKELYSREEMDYFINMLRQYFIQNDRFTGSLIDNVGGAYLSFPHGSFADTTNQTVVAINTGTVMTFNTTDFANDVSVVTSGGKASRVTVDNAGVYNFQWSGQFENTDSQDHDASIWVRKNGTDVVGSSGLVAVPSKHGSVNGHTIAGWNFLFQLNSGDYIELWWETDNIAVSIQAYPAVTTPPAAVRPSTSSLVATMTYVSRL